MKTKKMNGYHYIGTTEGVCGGEPIILGTRLKPEQIVAYGTIEEAVEDFELAKEQVQECHLYKMIGSLTEKEKEALKAAASVIYLNDRSDYINGLWDVIKAIVGDKLYEDDEFGVEKIVKILDQEEE
jgi:uncharacterized protein (DUF433 family)